ncbi:hypothetical protein FOZG_10289 [Fusarium oxysporum Fo47]|uniref:Uncharacterized protein n=1 Tax=Fusarium oxysporum Fo47 TaxID=660027 RepID=W9K7S3_FUSOX|nr:hypothetical protein FOZG_10289 [Fusarium oxysporum Fo47]
MKQFAGYMYFLVDLVLYLYISTHILIALCIKPRIWECCGLDTWDLLTIVTDV